MNKCMFTGRLTREPAYKAKGYDKNSMIAFTLAVNNSFGDTEKTLFIDCSAFDSLADRLSTELYKGVKVLVEGVLYTYDSQYGNNKLALTLKDCEIVQHTNAYLKQHSNILKDIEKRTEEVIKEAELYGDNSENSVSSKSYSKKKSKKSESKVKEPVYDWAEIEKSLGMEPGSSGHGTKTYNKYGLEEDEDGFIVCSGDEEGLPFD